MLSLSKSIPAFFELLRAGLWEKEVQLSTFDNIDFGEIYQIAEYQSVIGLIAAGIENLKTNDNQNFKMPQEWALQFIGQTLQLEQRNKAMNNFLRDLIDKLQNVGINAILVKGHGVAQCYERPLWRACGDIDLFLSEENYEKAKKYLLPQAIAVEDEEHYKRHFALTIEGWVVELHGNLLSSLSRSVENELDEIYRDTFYRDNVKNRIVGKTKMPQLATNNDVVYVFTHILQHYFHGGIGLRQVCDWCRMLWIYRDEIDKEVLERRLRKMQLISEWKAFAYFAVADLGMPENDMPFYDAHKRWKKKADRIKERIMQKGNFGHRDLSYVKRSYYITRKFRSFKNTIVEATQHFKTFPLDSVRFFFFIPIFVLLLYSVLSNSSTPGI